MKEEGIVYAKYTEGICEDGAAILKDGHTMFIQDIISDLNRKSYLEENKKKLEFMIDNGLGWEDLVNDI